MAVIEKRITIDAPVSKVYDFWHTFERFQTLLPSVKSIDRVDTMVSQWKVVAPFNTTVEFEATTVEDRTNEYMQWQSVHGAGTDVVTSNGEITFTPVGEGNKTEVHLRFEYTLPSTAAQRVVDTLGALGYPARDFDQNLRIIKEHIEQQ